MITTFKPKSKTLDPYIDFFYVFDQGEQNSISYIAFPHTNKGLSFFNNAHIQRHQNQVTIQAARQPLDRACIEILGKYLHPVFVNYSGNIGEVAIIFKPLGINHFLNLPLNSVAPSYSQAFSNEAWLQVGNALFAETATERRIDLLEAFLMTQLQNPDLKLMYEAIQHLQAMENAYSIERIASLLNMNLKTFQRHFFKHLGCSPSDYRRIARFRHSLHTGLLEKEIKTLTTIAHDSHYYDQSYFVREYKKLTSLNPKAFFNTITALDDNNIVWKIK